MKTKITLIMAILISAISLAQNGINYKAVIKDGSGAIAVNDLIQVQFTILDGASSVYSETHSPTTDGNGIIIINIGEGALVAGSAAFDTLDWSSMNHFLNVQINTGGGLQDMGTTAFKTVPYALKALSSSDNYWSKNGNAIYTLNDDVGINSMNPEHTLDVRAPSIEAAAALNVSNQDKSRYLRLFSGSSMFPDPSFTWAPDRSLLFASFDDNTLAFNEYMRISSLGDLGIGIVDPQAKLDILGGDWDLDAGNPGDLRIGNATHNFRIGVATAGGGAGVTRMYTNSNDLILGANGAPALILDQNGAVSAPSLTNTLIDNAGNKALVTKEYVAVLQAQIAALQPSIAVVGDIREGGVVFWVDPSDNTHGLVCTFSDYATERVWGCNNTDLPNVPNVIVSPPSGSGAEIGDGFNNTNNILKDCSNAPAALAARSYGPEWFLPSVKELNEMYTNKATLETVVGFSAFGLHFYWSSTEYDSSFAWFQFFDSGIQSDVNKTFTYKVRAVRAF